MQAYCKSRTSDAISALNSLRPNDALLLVASDWEDMSVTGVSRDLEKSETISRIESLPLSSSWNVAKIPVDHLEVGDIVRVPTGSSPPADGTIMPDQEGVLDESSLTGESRLIKKFPGEMVFVGTINKGPVLHLKVATIGKQTMCVATPSFLFISDHFFSRLDQIVQVVRDAQARRAPIERIADQITGHFVPIITLLAIITWVVWLCLCTTNMIPANYVDIESGGWRKIPINLTLNYH